MICCTLTILDAYTDSARTFVGSPATGNNWIFLVLLVPKVNAKEGPRTSMIETMNE